MWGTSGLLLWALGYSRKNPNMAWVEGIYTFLKKSLGIYRFVTLSLEKKLSPLEILQNCATPFRNSRTKKPRSMKNQHDCFLITPGKRTSFLLDPGISACSFSNTPLKFHVINFPCLDFVCSRVVIKNVFGSRHFIRN